MFYPLEILSQWLTYQVFSIPHGSLLGDAVEFFIFDLTKIFLLLFILIFLVSFFRSYVSKEKIQKFLSQDRVYLGYSSSLILGILTPFCSCSAIPFFLTFLQAGVPIGMIFSFLVASPMVNEVALILLLGLFGIKIAFLYVISGLVISLIAGIALQKMGAEKWILKDMLINFSQKNTSCSCHKPIHLKTRILEAKHYTFSIIKKISPYVVLGIGLGAWIHGYVPDDFLAKPLEKTAWYNVPVAVLIGLPLYSNAAGVIPLVSSLIEKGLSLGTALAFMMAMTGLSLPEFIILKRIMKWKLIFSFAAIVGIGIILIGYLFNFLLS